MGVARSPSRLSDLRLTFTTEFDAESRFARRLHPHAATFRWHFAGLDREALETKGRGFKSLTRHHYSGGGSMLGLIRDGLAKRWRHLRQWVRDGKTLWYWIVAAAVLFGAPASLACLSDHDLADGIRWSGLAFQIVGLLTVVWGLEKSGLLFEKPSPMRRALGWLSRLRYVFVPPKRIVVSGVGLASGSAAVTGVGQVWPAVKSDSVSDRLAKLEADQKLLKQWVGEVHRSNVKLGQHIDNLIAREQEARRAVERALEQKIEKSAIGDIDLEIAGVALLFLGITLATIPEEVAQLLLFTFFA